MIPRSQRAAGRRAYTARSRPGRQHARATRLRTSDVQHAGPGAGNECVARDAPKRGPLRRRSQRGGQVVAPVLLRLEELRELELASRTARRADRQASRRPRCDRRARQARQRCLCPSFRTPRARRCVPRRCRRRRPRSPRRPRAGEQLLDRHAVPAVAAMPLAPPGVGRPAKSASIGAEVGASHQRTRAQARSDLLAKTRDDLGRGRRARRAGRSSPRPRGSLGPRACRSLPARAGASRAPSTSGARRVPPPLAGALGTSKTTIPSTPSKRSTRGPRVGGRSGAVSVMPGSSRRRCRQFAAQIRRSAVAISSWGGAQRR